MHSRDAKHHVHVQGRKERRQPWLVLFLQLSYLQRKKKCLRPPADKLPFVSCWPKPGPSASFTGKGVQKSKQLASGMGRVINTALDQKSCPSRGEHRDRIATAGKYFLPNTDPRPKHCLFSLGQNISFPSQMWYLS